MHFVKLHNSLLVNLDLVQSLESMETLVNPSPEETTFIKIGCNTKIRFSNGHAIYIGQALEEVEALIQQQPLVRG